MKYKKHRGRKLDTIKDAVYIYIFTILFIDVVVTCVNDNNSLSLMLSCINGLVIFVNLWVPLYT